MNPDSGSESTAEVALAEVPEHEVHTVTSTDGVEVVVRELGGEGPPLVLSHATGFHGACWLPVAETLAEQFRCVAIDYRGHGASVIPAETSLRWRHMANDLDAVLDHLGIGSGEAYVAGHSMGGCVALLAAQRRPGFWRSVWVFEPIVIPGPDRPGEPGENDLVEVALKRRDDFESRAAVFERYASRPPFDATDPRFLAAYVAHGFVDTPDGAVRLACTPEQEAGVFNGAFCDAFSGLGELSMPVTVVASGDGHPPSQLAPMVADAIPDGRLVRMDHLDHFGPFTEPEEIAGHISSTLLG